jgi:hypothetical protein
LIINNHHTTGAIFANAIVEFSGCSIVKLIVACILGSSKHGKALKNIELHFLFEYDFRSD